MERHSKERVPTIDIYTDGSTKSRGRFETFGGWAFIAVRDNEKIYQASGSVFDTTNQRMELFAACQGLLYAQSIRRKEEKVVIYSDSAYLTNCYLQEWYVKWQSNGWQNANGKPVANVDLWLTLIPYFDHFWYNFKKVPGHANNFWNILCDELARNEAEKLKHNWRGIASEPTF